MIETSLVPPRKSSATFGNLRKMFENVRGLSSSLRNNFAKSSEILGKWSEIFGKSSKTSLLVCFYNKQRHRVEHEKINVTTAGNRSYPAIVSSYDPTD